MEQHAIPQQISSYEFKLVGEMTLKQFLKAAGGIVLALIINASGLIFFIKWPLIILSGGGGLALAFVPFQDRPLEQWVMAFIKAIYSPTIYTYKKVAPTDWIDLKLSGKNQVVENEVAAPIKDKAKVAEFIKSLPSVKKIEEEQGEVVEQNSKVENLNSKELINDQNIVKAPVEMDDQAWRDTKANLNLKTEKLGATGEAVFGQIPMPDKPTIPNLLVGMVTDHDGKIVEGAIVEIQDEKGNPSRVLKTNALGQFRATTPLANGRYLMITEKENYKFDRVNVDLTGVIVDPVKIQSILV